APGAFGCAGGLKLELHARNWHVPSSRSLALLFAFDAPSSWPTDSLDEPPLHPAMRAKRARAEGTRPLRMLFMRELLSVRSPGAARMPCENQRKSSVRPCTRRRRALEVHARGPRFRALLAGRALARGKLCDDRNTLPCFGFFRAHPDKLRRCVSFVVDGVAR